MAGIRVTPEELQQQGQKLINMATGEIAKMLTDIESQVTLICDSWDGLAQDAFLQSYEGMKENLKLFPQIVEGIGNQTVTAATTFGEVDSQLSSSFKG